MMSCLLYCRRNLTILLTCSYSYYSIDVQLFLKAAGNDEDFAAIKENPEVLNMVDLREAVFS